MADTLTLSTDRRLRLPLDVVTRTTGVVGQRGTGKTSTAVVLVEEAARAGAPFVVIDPTGAWYGLRSSSDGKRAGLDVVVLGGHNGDLPLSAAAGEYVARLLVEQRRALVLDLERMTKGEQVRFVAEFAETLYHLNREALLVVMDEAHRFAPQSLRDPGGYGARCLGAVSDVVTLGRRKGLGAVLISQRPAKINKDVLEQAEVMVAHRLMGPNDRKALAGWMDEAHVEGSATAQLAALSALGVGEAIVWAPAFDVYGSFQIRPKRTFDSSATPEVGQAVTAPTGRPRLDLDEIRAAMSDAVEEAAANDPKALRARVADLERQLATAHDEAEHGQGASADLEAVQAWSNLTQAELDDVAELLGLPKDGRHGAVRDRVATLLAERDEARQVAEARDVFGALLDIGHDAQKLADYAKSLQAVFRSPEGEGAAKATPWGKRAAEEAAPRTGTTSASARKVARAETSAPPQPPTSSNGDGPELVAGARRMLDVLERYGPLTRMELSTLAKSHGGAARSNLSALRTAGYVVEEGGRVQATAQGLALARSGVRGGPLGPFTPEQVVAMYEGDLVAGARRILSVLMRAPDKGFTRSELEGLAQSRGGAFRSNLSALRRAGLAEEHRRRVFPGHALYPAKVGERGGS